jgi:hypothetical protein
VGYVVFELQDSKWRTLKAKGIRPISTIIMDEKETEALSADHISVVSRD